MTFVGYGSSQFLVSHSVRNYGRQHRAKRTRRAWARWPACRSRIGTFSGGYLSDRLARSASSASLAGCPALGVLIAMPIYMLSFDAADSSWAFAYPDGRADIPLPVSRPDVRGDASVSAAAQRATAIAILMLIVNLIGYGLGPPLVGALNGFSRQPRTRSRTLTAAQCARAPANARPAVCAPALAHWACGTR